MEYGIRLAESAELPRDPRETCAAAWRALLPEGNAVAVYFGSEFCEDRLPAFDEAKAFRTLARDRGLEPTLLTPLVTPEGLRAIAALAAVLVADDWQPAVVCNDWGVVALLRDLRRMRGVRDLSREQTALESLAEENLRVATTDVPSRQILHLKCCEVRRRIAFANPLLDFDRLLLIRRGLPEEPRDLPTAKDVGDGKDGKYAKAKQRKESPYRRVSTGLDPGARRELWQSLERLRTRTGATVAMTTHLMDEAAGCDRVAILNAGSLVALGSPAALTATIGGDVLWVTSSGDAGSLALAIADRFSVHTELVDDRIRLELPHGHEFVTDVIEAFSGRIDAVTFSRPTLEDVFVHHTGRRFE